MPNPVNWAHIESGATFHELVGQLLLQETPPPRIFNREGRDGAVDALSHDGKTVYQSKHHKNGTAADAIADAKKELTRIREYKVPGHRWHSVWNAVDTWILVTNVRFGTADDERWRNEVVPAFAGEGLTAEYLHLPELEAMLAKHPDIANAFFGGQPRLFISLGEHREKLAGDPILERAYEIPLQDRIQEIDRIAAFASDATKRVLLVHGPGGVGKSRLLYEAAYHLANLGAVETVYCATRNLESGRDWYVGIVPESEALVLLDDPKDPGFVERLLDELRGRTKRWKVLAAVQSPNDKIINILTSKRDGLLAAPLEVKPLAGDEAAQYAESLVEPLQLSGDFRPRVVKWLVEVCGGFPMWMVVAVRLLETQADLRNLPADQFGIAKGYIDEVIRNTEPGVASADQVRELLRFIALLQPLNRGMDDELGAVASLAGFRDGADVDRVIQNLADRGVVSRYGVAKRMVEIRPDVLRDHLLIDWLTYSRDDARRPSSEALALARRLANALQGGDPVPLVSRIVRALGRLERIVPAATQLLDPVADAVVAAAEGAPDSLAQRRVIESAKAIATFRPTHLAHVARAIRTLVVPEVSDGIPYFPSVVTREDVVDALPWELFRAAHTAADSRERQLLLDEMAALVDEQAGTTRGKHGGTGAADLLKRILHERHGYRSSFNGEATAMASAALSGVERGEPIRESQAVLFQSILQVERHVSHTDEHDDSKLVMETIRINPAGESGAAMMAIRDRLWTIVTSAPSVQAKHFAWDMLDELHREASRASDDPNWRGLVLDDIRKCRQLLSSAGVPFEDVQAAHGLSAWHARYDQNAEAKQLAVDCEAAYLRHPIAAKYAPIFGRKWVDVATDFQAAVAAFPPAITADEIAGFFEGALAFTQTHSEKWRENQVEQFAWTLGEQRGGDASVQDFARNRIGKGPADSLFRFALAIAVARLQVIRRQGDPKATLAELEGISTLIGDEAGRVQLLARIYGGNTRTFTAPDYEFLTRHPDAFAGIEESRRFEILGRFLAVHPDALENAAAQLAKSASADRAVAMLWAGYYDSLPYDLDTSIVSTPVVDRLLELTALCEDPVGIGDHSEWQIRELVKHVPPKSIGWLVDMSRKRYEAFSEHNRRCLAERVPGHISAFPDERSIVVEVVRSIPDGPVTDEDARAIDALCAIAADNYMEEYQLPALLVSLDPHGRYVPAAIAHRIADPLQVPGVSELSDVARFAGSYPIGSSPWREIAVAACRRLHGMAVSDDDRLRVHSALSWHGLESWGGHPQQLHPRWQDAVDTAQKALHDEAEPALRPFWEWQVRCAQAELDRAKGELEEKI